MKVNLIYHWQGCDKPGQIFWCSRSDALFCSDRCRYRYHNSLNREVRLVARMETKMMVTKDKILAKLFLIYGSKPLPRELLRSHGYIEDPPCTQLRSEHSGRMGYLFIQYIYSPVEGSQTFQVFYKKDYDQV